MVVGLSPYCDIKELQKQMLEKNLDGSKTLKFAPNSQNCVSLEPQVIIGFLYKMYCLVHTLNMKFLLCFTNAIEDEILVTFRYYLCTLRKSSYHLSTRIFFPSASLPGWRSD